MVIHLNYIKPLTRVCGYIVIYWYTTLLSSNTRGSCLWCEHLIFITFSSLDDIHLLKYYFHRLGELSFNGTHYYDQVYLQKWTSSWCTVLLCCGGINYLFSTNMPLLIVYDYWRRIGWKIEERNKVRMVFDKPFSFIHLGRCLKTAGF